MFYEVLKEIASKEFIDIRKIYVKKKYEF